MEKLILSFKSTKNKDIHVHFHFAVMILQFPNDYFLICILIRSLFSLDVGELSQDEKDSMGWRLRSKVGDELLFEEIHPSAVVFRGY